MTPEEEVEVLRLENAALREELREQWESNHAEHCGSEWPHPEGKDCYWPLPAILRQNILE